MKTCLLLILSLVFVSCNNNSVEYISCYSFSKIERKEYFKDISEEFKSGSGIEIADTSEITIQNLFILGKVWGYLKYYHPVVASGYYNWDYELFRIIPVMLQCKTSKERSIKLVAWIDSLEKFEIYRQEKDSSTDEDIKMLPDLKWIGDSVVLGSELSNKLTAIKNAGLCGINYYVFLEPDVGNPVFNEAPYEEMNYSDDGFKLLALYRYWNIVQYYYPYKYLITDNWDAVLKECIKPFLKPANRVEYKLMLSRLLHNLHDSHGNIWESDSAEIVYKGWNFAPIKCEFVDELLFVSGFYDTAWGKTSGLLKGDRVIKIGKEGINSVIEREAALLSYSGPQTLEYALKSWGTLFRTNAPEIELEVLRNNENRIVKVSCFPLDIIKDLFLNPHSDTCFKMFNNVAYLHAGSLFNRYIPQIMPKVMETKGLIIDLRQYPREFMVFNLGEYLLPSSQIFCKKTIGSISSPGLFRFDAKLSIGEDNPDYYKGKVILLVDGETQSQGEFTTMAFSKAPNALIVGSPTAGADGNVSEVILPGDVKTAITGIGIYYPDGGETQRKGIIPDIIVKPTLKGIIEGRDELLDKAIEIINSDYTVSKTPN